MFVVFMYYIWDFGSCACFSTRGQGIAGGGAGKKLIILSFQSVFFYKVFSPVHT